MEEMKFREYKKRLLLLSIELTELYDEVDSFQASTMKRHFRDMYERWVRVQYLAEQREEVSE